MNGCEKILPLAFAFLFVGMWCFVLRVLSIVSGWTRLAARFHHPGRFDGEHYRFQSARLKQVNFRNALEMGVNQQGLYLVPMVLFRLFHQPLLIPWGELQAEPSKKFLFHGYRLSFRSFPDITLETYDRTFEKMVGYLKALADASVDGSPVV